MLLNIFIVLIALYVSVYTFMFSQSVIKSGNRLGGLAVVLLSLMTLASPYVLIAYLK